MSTKTPKPTLPTDTAATTPEDTETLAACITAPETPPAPAPEQETPAATDKGGLKPSKSASGSAIVGTEILRPERAFSDHRVQLVGHIHPDGTCDALTTTPPRVVIASRILAGMMQQPRFVAQIVGRREEREKATGELVAKSLALADELLRQAAESYFDTPDESATPEA